MQTQFIRIQNKLVRVDSIGYIDFLESGRAMIFVPGLNQEKQMISIDPEEAKRLREAIEGRAMPEKLARIA